MARDFTLTTYRQLLTALQSAGYRFLTFEQYCDSKSTLAAAPFVILRHDVDAHPANSLRTAQIEHELGIRASYYFRVVPASNQPGFIRSIAALGHEIGYHYEDVSLANGDIQAAIGHFEQQLSYFRHFYPVRTICMHGAPTSRWDGRELWKTYDYHSYGIIGEPYFDVDFSHVFYLTDTGRRWDGFRVSLRDKIPLWQDQWIARDLVYHSTADLLCALAHVTHDTNSDKPGTTPDVSVRPLPSQLMITTHPQRWTDNSRLWLCELLLQSLKNIIKHILIILRTS